MDQIQLIFNQENINLLLLLLGFYGFMDAKIIIEINMDQYVKWIICVSEEIIFRVKYDIIK